METAIIMLALLTAIHLIYSTFEFYFGFKKLKNLPEQTSIPAAQLPSVSIIFSALNEAPHMGEALNSMLNLDYPHLEIIALNDRSTDETGEILDQFARQNPQLQVVHIHNLPENWLGKNHALYLGAKKAKGEWLLFTDADVIMKKTLLEKAMSYVLEAKLDHLTIYEQHLHKPFWLRVLSLGGYVTYCMQTKPWRVRLPNSSAYLGHGAFNLVNKKAYQRAGTHRAIALECLDDMQLGRLIKYSGCKQDTVNGRDLLMREWYSSLGAMIQGLSKNGYAFFNFKLWRVCRDFTFALLYYFWPLCALLLYSDIIFWLNALNVLLMLNLNLSVCKHFRIERRLSLFYPIGVAMLLYTVWYSVYLTYKNNGIIWRGTHYVLQKLRNKSIPEEIIEN